MPREHKITVYKFEELSEKAKKRAIDDYRNKGWSWDQHDNDQLDEIFKQDLEEWGLDDPEVYWSLGYSQGDGVAFSGNLDVKKWISKNAPKKFRPLIGQIEVHILHDARLRYHHWNSMGVEISTELERSSRMDPKEWFPGGGGKAIARLIDEFEAFVEEAVKEFSRGLEKAGYQEIEYKESEEYISDIFEGNDYEFTEDGKIWHR